MQVYALIHSDYGDICQPIRCFRSKGRAYRVLHSLNSSWSEWRKRWSQHNYDHAHDKNRRLPEVKFEEPPPHQWHSLFIKEFEFDEGVEEDEIETLVAQIIKEGDE